MSGGYWVGSALLFVAFLYKLGDLLVDPRNASRRALCAMLLLASCTLLAVAPTSIAAVNAWTGVPNFAAVLAYCLIVAVAASIQILVAFWRYPPATAWRRSRWWLLGYGTVIIAMMILFLLGEAPIERRVDFDTYYARTPYISGLILSYLVAGSIAYGNILVATWQWSNVAGRPSLRRGLRLIVVSMCLDLACNTCKLIAVFTRWLGHDLDFLSSSVAPGLSVLGAGTGAIGCVFPVVGHRLAGVSSWIRRYRAYRGLFPLWDGLRAATPQIVAPIPLPWWDLDLRITRRLAEIRDGILAVRPHVNPDVAKTAMRHAQRSGLERADRDAAVEAACLAYAIGAKARRESFPRGTGQETEPVAGGVDGMDELDWLVKVSRAYATLPMAAHAIPDDSTRDAPVTSHEGQ
ncbi:MAB_1171c family putative transporter [Plantactinospora sp. CA-290183]|uniref:MAB_1171c family putative transporter n=1 Tax=Plantactinospora sp. CA-290183 TaxID=3240006 RepID=UPI003D8DBD05